LASPEIKAGAVGLPRAAVTAGVREVLDAYRRRLLAGEIKAYRTLAMSELTPLVVAAAKRFLRPAARRVINATGIIIHTNLGRAPLAVEAAAVAADIATAYSNLEYDLAKGERGGRTGAVESLLVELSGAEAALAVNNNAAALLLVLAALSKGREVVVSRGELIEIGGSFRLPEIMAAAGCVMREVGTTNKTHLKDYESAIGKKTALLLKAHTSNYRVIGFTAGVSLAELATLGKIKKKAVVEDLGSGNLIDLPGLNEPTVRASVDAGADLVTFSGDKLLGGPQCGLIVGRAALVAKLRTHPIYRAVRLDKMNLAALEATLRLYLFDDPLEKVPILALLNRKPAELKARAQKLAAATSVGDTGVAVVQTQARVGGGSLPGETLMSYGLRLVSPNISADGLATRLRQGETPIIGRIENDGVILDMIAVDDNDIETMAEAIERVLNSRTF